MLGICSPTVLEKTEESRVLEVIPKFFNTKRYARRVFVDNVSLHVNNLDILAELARLIRSGFKVEIRYVL